MELLQNRGLYEEGFGARDGSSEAMRQAVLQWFDLYYNGGVLQLPYTIVRKLVRAVFAEYSCDGEVLAGLPHRMALEMALIGGECYLKPVFLGTWQWQVVPRGSILVFSRDWNGEPTDVGLMEKSTSGRNYYTLLERRRVDSKGMLTVVNRLFRSGNSRELGREVPLASHSRYAALPESYTYPRPIGSVGLVRLRTPMANSIDGSREGMSIYAPALGLIAAIEENEGMNAQEFRNGQSRLVVSRDMLRDGQLADNLFVALDDSPEAVGITVFAPELRQSAFQQRQQACLRSLENVIGLKRGLLSEVEAADRTATEITSSEGEYMTTLLDLRDAFADAACRCAGLVGTLEGRSLPMPEIHWGDGVV